MKRIPSRQLGNESSKVLAEVSAGETITVTNNGETQAVLIPSSLTPLQRGQLSGSVQPATSATPLARITRVLASVSVQVLVEELKGER